MAGSRVWVIAVAVLVAAGCGGSARLTKSQFEHQMQAEAQQLNTALQKSNAATATSLKQLAIRIDSLQPAFKKAADDIGKLKPPQDAAADTSKIAAALRKSVELIGEIQQAASANDSSKTRRFVNAFEGLGKSLQPALKDLKKKGYDVGLFAGG